MFASPYLNPHRDPTPAPPDSTPPPLPAPGEQIEAIAVLPFENTGKNSDNDYLCNGLSESIINSLSAARSLKVRPFSAVSGFKSGTAAAIPSTTMKTAVSVSVFVAHHAAARMGGPAPSWVAQVARNLGLKEAFGRSSAA